MSKFSKNKTKKEINSTPFFVETNESKKVIKSIIFPHKIQVGLPDNSIYDAKILGSIQKLADGTTNFIQAGANVTVTNNADGSITIASTGGGGGGGSGDITSVIAGSGLTGGATTGDATLNIGAGTGIDVTSDEISVDVSDFMTNGADNRVVTATGADALNAEENLTFDGSLLTVDGNVSVSQKIQHIGDTDTHISFDTDSIVLTAGDKSMIEMKEAGTDTQFLILSGGAGVSQDETLGNDVMFYVSGSKGSRGTSERGTSVFGGDVHISGSINKSTTTYAFYQNASPTGDPTNEFHFEWAQGTVDAADPENTNQNNFWQYFPKGGKILSIDARGGGTTNFSDSFPSTYEQRMVVALYQFNDTWINSSENTAHAGYTPIGHVTSSLPSHEFANESGTYHHRAVFELTPQYISQNVTGSFDIPSKSSITLTYKGIGSSGALQKCTLFVTVEKNI